ncbi:MAG: hypothetical protein U0836_23995 [Pirellulales bacterium]
MSASLVSASCVSNLPPSAAQPRGGPCRCGVVAAASGFVAERTVTNPRWLEIQVISMLPAADALHVLPFGWDRVALSPEDRPGWDVDPLPLSWGPLSVSSAVRECRRIAGALPPAPLYHARCRWPIPRSLRKVGYVQLRLGSSLAADRQPFIERPKRFLALGMSPGRHYGFLRDADELAECTERLVDLGLREGIFTRPLDETATDALNRAYYVLVGGYDVPLGDRVLNVEAIRQLQACWNFAQWQLRRQRRTRFGLASKRRHVVPLANNGSSEDPLQEVFLRELLANDGEGIRRHIYEFSAEPRERRLLELIGTGGRSEAEAARQLGVSLLDARGIQGRFVAFLLRDW